jgi:hypothetical protein
VDVLAEVFKLTEEERKRLSQFPIGQGLFFAGQSHVHIQIIASPTETSLITTNPQQLMQMQAIYQQQQPQQIQMQMPQIVGEAMSGPEMQPDYRGASNGPSGSLSPGMPNEPQQSNRINQR